MTFVQLVKKFDDDDAQDCAGTSLDLSVNIFNTPNRVPSINCSDECAEDLVLHQWRCLGGFREQLAKWQSYFPILVGHLSACCTVADLTLSHNNLVGKANPSSF